MEMKDIIAKVNYFSKLARERELTEAEKEERQKYRHCVRIRKYFNRVWREKFVGKLFLNS